MKEARDWIEQYASSAMKEHFEEQKEKLSDVAYPITSKLYGGAEYHDGPAEHDEL